MMAVANVATQATSSATTGTALKSTTGKTHVSTAAHAAHAAHVAHAAHATAAHVVHAAPATAPTTVSLSGLLLQVIIALGVIILFVWLVSKAARSRPGRILLGGAGITGGGMFGAFGSKRQTPINVISRQMLGKGMSLVIVEVEGKLLMLGVTQHNISVLADLAEESSEDAFGNMYDSFGGGGGGLSSASPSAQAQAQAQAQSAGRQFSRASRPVAVKAVSQAQAAGQYSIPATDKSNISPIDFLRELTIRRSVGR